MALRDNELARREEGKLSLRPVPVRVTWRLADLSTADNHELRLSFTCSARILSDPAERRMFEEVVLCGRSAFLIDDLAAHFESPIKSAAATTSGKHTAADWLGGSFKEEMITALRKSAEAVAFGCGVEILAPFQLELQSPSFERQRLRMMQQSLAEAQTAGQIEHVQRAAELLKQFQTIRSAAPDLSPGRVLQQISPADRGAVLQTLLLASAREGRAQRLWAVAGPYLVEVEIANGPPKPHLYSLPTALGPLRSVSAVEFESQNRLVVGARSGFMLVDPSAPGDATSFKDHTVESQLGFNRVLYWGHKKGFVATHGDAGIVQWDAASAGSPKTALRPGRFMADVPRSTTDSMTTHAPGPRNLQIVDANTLIFSAGGRLFLTDLDQLTPVPTESNADIVSIIPDDRQMFVIHEDGTICGFDLASRKLSGLARRGGRIRSAGALPWLGSTRLLLACEDGPLNCIGFDDQLITEYQSAHRGIRAVAGTSDLIAGISGDRQRLILWQSWEGRQPLTEVYLTGATRHRVADVAFG
jgi:hypothetical protein